MNHDDRCFRLKFPLDRPHCGMPLANGNMGVLVWGQGTRLSLTVNRGDFWDHRQGEYIHPGQTYRDLVAAFDPYDVTPVNDRFVRAPRLLDRPGLWWPSTRLPVGRFDLELDVELSDIELDYATGTVTVRAGTRQLRLVQVRERQQLLIEDNDSLVLGFVPRPAWEWVGTILSQVGFEPPQLWEEGDGKGWFQAVPADPGINVMCRRTAYGLAVGLELDNVPCREFFAVDFAVAMNRNTEFWRKYWSAVPSIAIPDEFLCRFYRFALYKFACATDPVGGVAATLQGPWLEEYQRAQWSCDYHFNVNIQQIYTLGFGIGAFDHLLPLFDMLESESFQRVMRENAKNLFGIDDGLLLTHAVDDRGYQCGGIHVGSALDFACGGWTAQLYWWYYRYTGDEKFLRERALPFITGVMRIYEAALEEHDGRLSLPLSISAEYGCVFPVKKDGRLCRQNSGRDPSNQLMCIHMLADALIEGCRVLGLEPKPFWLEIKQRLPHYTLTGEPGEEHIALWEGQDLDICHRHHSHLAGIYPFETLNDPTPEQQQIIDHTVDHWIIRGMGQWSEWCYPWAAIIQARLGFKDAPALLLGIWKEIFVNEGWTTVYLPQFRGLTAHRRADMVKPKATSEIMQLDGTMAGATAIIEMLVHERAGAIYLFPGVPDKWRDIVFERIRLPGTITVSAVRQDGRSIRVKVRSELSGPVTLRLPEQAEAVTLDLTAGEERELQF